MKKILILLLLSFSLLFCHPHIFIDGKIKPSYKNNTFNGFYLEWVFDEMFTTVLIEDYDDNPDGKLDETELKTICKETSANLKEYNFYCDLIINNKSKKITKINNFTAKLINNKMVFNMFIPIQVKKGTVNFSVYDKTYYAFFENKASNNLPQSKIKIKHSIKNKNTDFYGKIKALCYTIKI